MSYALLTYNSATLTLDNITYTTNRSHTIWINNASNVNILNTKIKSTTGSSSNQITSNILYEQTSTGKLTITNSKLISDNDALINRNGGSTDPDSFTIEIKDSYFKNESLDGTSPYKIMSVDKALSQIIGEGQVVSQTGTKVQTSVVADTITTDDGTELTIYTPATLEADTKTYDKYSLSADHTLVEIRTKLSPVGTYDGIYDVTYNSIRLANGEILYAEDDSAFALLYDYYNSLSVGSYAYNVVLKSGKSLTFTLKVVDTTPTYKVTSGANQQLLINSNKDLIINIDGLNSLLTSVYVNNQLLSNNNYTVSGERTSLTLNNNYLKSLEEGTYTVKVTYSNDKEVITTFKVVKAMENPNTFDGIINSIMLGGLSVIGLVVGTIYITKKKVFN